MDLPLLDAISAQARNMLANMNSSAWSRSELHSFALGLLGIAWAHAFLTVEPRELGTILKKSLMGIGCQLDGEYDKCGAVGFTLPELEPEAIRGIMAKEPHLEIELQGMVVIHKQPDWEVDGKVRARSEAAYEGGIPALSRWLRARLPRSQHPLTRNAALDFGFLHRLDVPSSGLILCGTTFTGLLCLRHQLDTYLVERQYSVWGHGLADVALREVVANIDPQTVESRRSFVSEVNGKPAKSWFTIPAHLIIPSSHRPPTSPESCSVFVIRIRTGRRHQIRAHMLHVGHPTVVDAKYAAIQVSFYHLAACEQGYLHSNCPD